MSGTDIHTSASAEESFDDWDVESPMPVLFSESDPRARAGAATPGNPMRAVTPEQPRTPKPIPMQDKLRHFPAFMSRSAIFGIARTAPIAPLVPMSEVMVQGKYSLEYEGPRLNMMDKAVWQAVVDLAKESALDLNEPLHASLSEIAKRVGSNSDGGRVLNAMWRSLRRLVDGRVDFTLISGHVGSGQLLLSVGKDASGAIIRFDPGFATPALGLDLQFLVDARRRQSLDTMLAQWLHDFFSTHSEGRPVTLGYLRDLCGFNAQTQRFPARLKAAMHSLKGVAPNLIETFEIERHGKDSDRWTLTISRGPEPVAFKDPSRGATAHQSTRTGKGPRRSGVAL